jgi:hypothetical protein
MRIDFHHQAVRDLAWVIGSAGLLRSQRPDRVSDQWCRIAFLDRVPWLRYLDNHPAELEGWLERHKSRLLGHYFEALIAFWLQQWPRMQLLASRLPVQGEEKVLGEFDFLFYDRYRARFFHWESAVKFFLRHLQSHDGYAWLGPNPRDTLEKKYLKVFEHQLKLSSVPAAKPLLDERGVTAITPQAFFKGYLFYPAGSDWQHPQPTPPDSSPHHLHGWWCHADQLEQIPYIAEDSRWLSLERLHWLSPVISREPLPGLNRASMLDWLSEHFADSGKPVLLAELRPDSDGRWREANRGFVVPVYWPQPVARG